MTICRVEDCDRPVKARGWCNRHWLRWWRHGSTDDPRKPERFCTVPGCERKHCAKGLCDRHWSMMHKRGTVEYHCRAWTQREDDELLALPVHPKTGWVLHGHLEDAALRLGRWKGAASTRRRKLLREAG